jgi:hypothetical protein
VLAVVAAAFAGVSLIAAVLFVVQVVWPRGGNTPVIEYDSRFAAVAQGLACIVPAVATVVVFSFVHDVWRDLRYGDEGDDVDVISPTRRPRASYRARIRRSTNPVRSRRCRERYRG